MKNKASLRTIFAASSLLVPSSVSASSGNWNVDNLGNWSAAGNWNPAAVPGTAAGDVVGLTNNISANRTVTIDTTSRTVGTLNIGDSDNSHAFTLAASGGATLTFNNSGSGASIVESGTVNDNITATVILADNLSISTAGSLRMTGGISESGARSLTKSGSGTLVLAGTNSYTGGTSVTGGTLSFRTIAAKSTTGAHTFSAGTTLGLGIGTGGFTAADIQNAFAGTFTGNLSGISIGSSNNIAIDTTSAAATLSANIGSSSRGLVKIEGGSNLTLTGNNQYSGRTVVAGGSSLVVNSLGNIADASSNIGTNSTIDMLNSSRIDISTTSSSNKHFNILGNAVIFPGAITFTHTGSISSETSGSKTVTFATNDTSLTNVKDFQGVISDGSGTIAITKSNGGNIWLSGNNTYTGSTSIGAGIVIIGHANALGSTTAGTSVSNGATLGIRNGITTSLEALTMTPGSSGSAMLNNFSGNNIWSGSITSTGSSSNQTSRIGSDADQLKVAGLVTISGTGNQLVFQGAGNIEVTGQITGTGLISSATNGTGVRRLSNDTNNFTGQTRVNGGTLEFTSVANVGGGASALGAPTTIADGTINLGFDATAATLRYAGTAGGGHSSDRVINLAGSTGTYTLEASGTGPLALGADLTGTGAGTKTLVLGGTNTGDNSIAAIPNGSSGTVALTKSGDGKWILTGTNTYSGATSVDDGTLLINGSTTSSSTVSVASGATLGGAGTIGGAVNVTGILSPGASVQTLATGTLSLANGSTFVQELNSSVSNTVGADLLTIAGDLNLAGTVNLTLSDIANIDTAFTAGTVFSLINYTGSWNSGLFTLGANELADEEVFTFGLNTWRISYDDAEGGLNFSGEYAGGSDSFVNLHAVVPEPGAALLGGIGMLFLLRRRQR